MAQCSTFPSGILRLQYFRFVRLLVNLIESGIFITTFCLKVALSLSNVPFLASAIL